MILSVERLEGRNVPATVAVTVAQLTDVHDKAGYDGEADIGLTINVPASTANAIILLRLPNHLDCFIKDYGHATVTVKDFIVQEVHWGITKDGANQLALEQGLPLFELTIDPNTLSDRKLPVEQWFIDMVDTSVGSVFSDAFLAESFTLSPSDLMIDSVIQLATQQEQGYTLHSFSQNEEGNWVFLDSVFSENLNDNTFLLTPFEKIS